MNILVVGGGISPERDVSLNSARAIENALLSLGHRTMLYDWDGSEEWLQSNSNSFDMVFPILHGEGGEDGHIQKILEDLNVPFLGSSSSSSKNCIDKDLTRKALHPTGIKIPGGDVVDWDGYTNHELFSKPHVLKPVTGGSSINTHIIDDASTKDLNAIKESFEVGDKYLLEEFIFGTEVTASIIGDTPLPVVEIIPPPNEVFDFANKYNGKTREICPPENVSESVQNALKETAIQVHNIMSCRHLSRVDMIINEGCIYVLEINTMPGMTENSLFPRAALADGKSLSDVVQMFINLVGDEGLNNLTSLEKSSR